MENTGRNLSKELGRNSEETVCYNFNYSFFHPIPPSFVLYAFDGCESRWIFLKILEIMLKIFNLWDTIALTHRVSKLMKKTQTHSISLHFWKTLKMTLSSTSSTEFISFKKLNSNYVNCPTYTVCCHYIFVKQKKKNKSEPWSK